MSPDQIPVTQIITLIQDAVGIDVRDPTDDLLASGIIDSLAFVSLLVAIEREFGMSIDVYGLDLEDFQSVERITRFINLEITRSNQSANGRLEPTAPASTAS
jgi:acyl carrier protein